MDLDSTESSGPNWREQEIISVKINLTPLHQMLRQGRLYVAVETKPSVLCFRIIDFSGYGMYCAPGIHWSSVNHCPYRHPMLRDDERLRNSIDDIYRMGEYRHGFDSLDQMECWLEGRVREKIKQHDLYLSVWEVDQYFIGETQMVFNPKTARLISMEHMRENMGTANSPGLERRYSTELANYIAELSVGESLFWRDSKWFKTGPGVEFVKTEGGNIKPKSP